LGRNGRHHCYSRTQVKRYGVEWTAGLDYEQDWFGIYKDRFCLRTWKFGSIHQCVIDVKCDNPNGYVRICLNYQPSRDAAMKHALEWAKNYSGPQSPEELVQECYERWPMLYSRRIRVIDHLLCTIGNGYDWLDGGIICDNPEDWIVSQERDRINIGKALRTANAIEKEFIKLEDETEDVELLRKLIHDLKSDYVVPDPKNLPLPDDGKPYSFYPISSYSNILNIPEDATKEWLEFCLEGAILLRDRSANMDCLSYNTKTKNEKYGKKLVKQIQKRLKQ